MEKEENVTSERSRKERKQRQLKRNTDSSRF
jgi:hypothetical protein